MPAGDSWLFEIKCYGYRIQAAIAGDQVRLYTRNGHDWTRQFGYVAPALAQLTKGTTLIDGELCAMDATGKPNFTLLKNSLDGTKPVVFYAFDLLEQDGEDIARLPQIERKERLEALPASVPQDAPITYSEHIDGDGEAVFRAMCEQDFEGVVAKSPTARYNGRSSSSSAGGRRSTASARSGVVLGHLWGRRARLPRRGGHRLHQQDAPRGLGGTAAHSVRGAAECEGHAANRVAGLSLG